MSAASPHAIYEGWVTHQRMSPVAHRFRYRINYLLLDLDELPSAFAHRWLWSASRPSFAWLRRADHLGDPQVPLAEAVREILSDAGIDARGPIKLLTQLRYFGFVMNPVSFYFCYDGPGEELCAVVAEVHNTPWGEEHCYVLPVNAGEVQRWLDKRFHVSPFMPLDLRYRWEVSPPDESLNLSIENHRDDAHFFTASLRLQRRPWTTWELHRSLWLYPFMTQRIYAGIYWQALCLWWKGAPYFPHPGGLRTLPAKEKLACPDRG